MASGHKDAVTTRYNICLMGPDVVDVVAGGSLLVLMIKATHSLHIHNRSTLYIYKLFQHPVASDHMDVAPA